MEVYDDLFLYKSGVYEVSRLRQSPFYSQILTYDLNMTKLIRILRERIWALTQFGWLAGARRKVKIYSAVLLYKLAENITFKVCSIGVLRIHGAMIGERYKSKSLSLL